PYPVSGANISLAYGSAVVYQSGQPQTIDTSLDYKRLFLTTLGGSVVRNFINQTFLTVLEEFNIGSNVTANFDNDIVDVDGNIAGTGTIQLSSGVGATLNLRGNWTGAVGLTAQTGSTVVIDGATAQSLPGLTFYNLNFNKVSGDTTFTGPTTVNGFLTLGGGNVIIGNSFFIDVLATVTRTSGHFIGPLTMGMNGTPSRTFHVGTSAAYLPVDVDAAGAGTLTIEAAEGLHPNRTGTNVLSRYWTIASPSTVTALDSATFNYNQSDVVFGDETKYHIAHYDGASWTDEGDNVAESVNSATLTSLTLFLGDYVIGQRGSIGYAGQVAITSVNGGVNPNTNTPFSVNVETRHDDGTAANVTTATTIDILLYNGTGSLMTASSTINAGSSTAAISGLQYDTAESNVKLKATASAGETLDDGISAPFTVGTLPSTLTVTNLNDSGAGSLRDAITTVNGGGCATTCTINFNVAGTINVLTTLPSITTSNLTIDGYSAPGASANTNAFGQPSNAVITVSLDGSAGVPAGLDIAETFVNIKGLAIKNFLNGGSGVGVKFSGDNSGSRLSGCVVGLDASGTVAAPNGYGVMFDSSTEASVGGSAAADRNVIGSNQNYGVIVQGTSNTISVIGNYIGTNAALSAARANGTGVKVDSSSSSVSIGTSGIGNVISGNAPGNGVDIYGNGVDLYSNFIGPAGNTMTALPNSTGVYISGNFTMVGDATGQNVISGNSSHGINIAGDANSVDNNLIGIAPDGTTAMGNGGSGVRLDSAASSNTIGDTTANVIAHNTDRGISLHTSAGLGNVLRNNKVYSNGAYAIDLGENGATVNDATDSDSGPNNYQNYPTINSATINGVNLDLTVSLNSSSGLNANNFLIDVYRTDATANRPALAHLGSSLCVTGPVLSNLAFSVPLGTTTVGDRVAVTATAYSDTCSTPSEGSSELSPATILTGEMHWNNPAGGAWETAGNWSPPVVPTSADKAYIDLSGTYTVSVNSAASVAELHVGAVSGTQTLDITTGASVDFSTASTIDGNGRINVNGLGINGAGALDVTGILNWNTGLIGGTGALNINSGGTLNIAGAVTHTLSQRAATIAVGGTVNWTGGDLSLASGGSIANGGTFEVKTDSLLSDGGGDGGFTNTGTFRKSTTGGTTQIANVTFTHSGGQVQIQTGILDLADGTSTAAIDITSGAQLLINSDTYNFNGATTISGSGAVRVNGGTLSIGATNLTMPFLKLDSGTVSTAGTLNTGASGIYDWTGGTLQLGSSLQVGSSAQVNLSGASTKILSGGALTIGNTGTVTLGGSGVLSLQTGGNIDNSGTFDMTSTAGITNGGGGGGILNNAGAFFRKSTGASTATIANTALTNNGTLDVQAGILDVATLTSAGPIQIGNTCGLDINSDTATFNAGTSVTGAGILKVHSGGTLTVDGNVSIANLVLDAPGTVNGAGVLTYTNFLWNGGTMSGSGSTQGPASSTLSLATATSKSLARLLTIQTNANVNVTGVGSLDLSTGGSVTNAGTWDVQTNMTIGNAGGGGAFTNNNLFKKTTNSGPLTINNTAFNNAGTVDLQMGTIDLASGTNTGTFQTAASTEFTINSDTYTFGSGSSLTGAGSLHLTSGGIFTVTSSSASVSNYAQDAGTLNGGGSLVINNTGSWTGGIMTGAVTTQIPASSTLTIGGTAQKTLDNATLSVLASATATIAGNGMIQLQNGGNISNAGDFAITADLVFANGGSAGAFVNTGLLTKSFGTSTTNFSNVALTNNGGTLDIQNGIILVSGGFSQPSGTLKFLLSGVNPGTQHGQLSILGGPTPSFAGTLQIALQGLYQPLGGDAFRVINILGGTHTGDFTHPYTYPALTGGHTWSDAYDGSGLLLTVSSTADLSVTKTGPASVVSGGAISYTIVVNNASADSATSVTVTDTLPAGHTGISASGTGWTCTVVGDTVTCALATALATGNSTPITINANAPTSTGPITNIATVSSSSTDPNNANNSGSWMVNVNANSADLDVS
ncbi:MAG TPA: hypothetical protein VJZ00_23395, partial [Thermoanaerobaculia bacterium]|nr:hypothetical protein [Thermoanaerobaculia bacterium]